MILDVVLMLLCVCCGCFLGKVTPYGIMLKCILVGFICIIKEVLAR